VEQLAERAVTAHLSVRDLRDLVASEKAKAGKDEPQRGRKPIPVVARALTRARAALFRDTQNFTKALINELNEDQLEQALADAKAMSASLTGLVASLEKRTSAR
jgi:hypothetical protein